ncbi:MAG: adenylyl-sulfate reductase [Betaproteobacteria bacterium]|nr:adenylyl-sulfate reductase [Betaproteobacteria bacterium]
MLIGNPFAPLVSFVSPDILRGYLVLMALAVALGTSYDLVHGKKAAFFLRDRRRARAAARRALGAREGLRLAARTLLIDLAAFGEFCNRAKRIAHALMFYGFILYVATTVALVFGYPAERHPPLILPVCWNIGALMTLVGSGWFFFFLRVDVTHDGQSAWRLRRADLFLASLLASVAFGLLLEWGELSANMAAIKVLSGLYGGVTTLLFVTVAWSKFPHMFYKPVLAFQAKRDEASGASDLPPPARERGDDGG